MSKKEKQNNKFSLKNRLQYQFDNLMTAGLAPLLVLLSIFVFLMTLFFSSIIWLTGLHNEGQQWHSFSDAFWVSLMHITDQGTIVDDNNWAYRGIMFVATIMGIMSISTLVGLITSQINRTINDLRKGRSLVIERNHIVILGWSSKIFSIIDKLLLGNENSKIKIVILAPKDKIEMEDEIIEKIGTENRSRIICRTGSPIDINDLEIVNPRDSKSIVIISPDDSTSDAYVIKCIIALINHPNRRKEHYNIVAELHDQSNKDIASIIGGDELTLILSDEIIARVAVQTCLQPGLSIIYNKLLEFSDTKIHLLEIEELYGGKFEDAIRLYDNATAIGLFALSTSGLMLLNPKGKRSIKKQAENLDFIEEEEGAKGNDKIILVAKDDKNLTKVNPQQVIIQEEIIAEYRNETHQSKRILIMGHHKAIDIIIKELDEYLSATINSEITIVYNDTKPIERELQNLQVRNVRLQFKNAELTDRKELNNLDVHTYDHVMLLSGFQYKDVQESDANTLMTLMHLRQIKREKKARFNIISEMLDIKNRELAEIAEADDFIISDHIISLIMSQIARARDIQLVFDELFNSKGCEIHLKPAFLYINQFEESVNFHTILEAARRRNEIAIGYRIMSQFRDAKKDYGIVLNPHKSEYIALKPEDKIIVMAED
ncbi:MAG: hypothetical protein EAZ55_11935 [Cytophagales bacterium]|nr:MAG: hypothetical protein EAZ55_11935 [Cytophagales bacterium]